MNSTLDQDRNVTTNEHGDLVERKNEIQESIENWVTDARNLVQSPEFSRFAQSTLHLAMNTTSTIAKVCLLPITGPINLAGNVTNATVSFLTNTIISGTNQWNNVSANENAITDSALDQRSFLPIDGIWDRILHVSHVGLIWSFAKRCTKKAIQIIRHNGNYFHTVDTEHDSIQELEQPLEKESNNIVFYFLLRICNSHDIGPSNTESIQIPLDKNPTWKRSQKLFQMKKSLTRSKHENLDFFDYDPIIYLEMEIHKKIDSPTDDIIFDISSMKDALDSMSRLANHLAYIPSITHQNQNSDISTSSKMDSFRHMTYLKHSFVEWKPESKTNSYLSKLQSRVKTVSSKIQKTKQTKKGAEKSGVTSIPSYEDEDESLRVISTLLDNHVLVWSGKHNLSRMEYPTCQIYGYDVPLFKGHGIIHTSPESILSLLLDNDRIKEYNKHNLRRTNIAVLDDIMESYFTQKNVKNDGKSRCTDVVTQNIKEWSNIQTKIVSSKTSVPFTKFTIPFLTIVHARKLEKDDGYIIVSRSLDTSVGQKNRLNEKNQTMNENEKYKYASFMNAMNGMGSSSSSKAPSNHIIWGVNVIKPVKEDRNKTELTTVSQVQSTSLPKFLVHKIGVSGVVEFFTNLRQVFPAVK